MSKITLIEGPVGAGKSTYAAQLALEQTAVHLDLDDWMVTLFSADRPADDFMRWYAEVKERCLQQVWAVACAILETDTPVILELGLVQRQLREAFYDRLAPHDYALDVIVLEVPEAVRWQRVQQRNASTDGSRKMVVNEEIFALASRAWEAPDDAEIEARGIRLLPN